MVAMGSVVLIESLYTRQYARRFNSVTTLRCCVHGSTCVISASSTARPASLVDLCNRPVYLSWASTESCDVNVPENFWRTHPHTSNAELATRGSTPRRCAIPLAHPRRGCRGY